MIPKGIRILAIGLFIIGTYIWGIGFHNIDISWNMKRNAIDMGFGYPATPTDIYSRGINQMQMSYYLFFIAFLFFSMSYTNI
ncbi:MAG: hypothetical protein A2172_03765 [Candidatus Woykebacteria bacterium RBG_13_40_15]|uniref:Uncharacterized protein n=1 Tax=Candidatus Woykebacteria bacterium RBG_13_40_15 TaxID=1802593 RepID=A0A1G1W6K2_9BACT|nr:MAG: hypothetical protein A2172_03765 [Candidatus Woykebacteria bacterium RBG_13_40_15]